jgi:exopolysaccharide production protein ExoY
MTKTDEGFAAYPQRAYLRAKPRFYPSYGKRAMDIGLVLLALPAVLVLIFGLALVLALVQGGSPFFGHRRIGRDGQAFTCWKLRTMVPHAEACLQDYLQQNPQAAQEWRDTFKLANDPRVTTFGKIMRQTSLDELPQIWNILKGEMSLVGPRPVTAAEAVLYGPALAKYQALRPGLTGVWQVNGRNDTSYGARIAMDVEYGNRLSFWRDCRILLATVRAVAARSGR